jgi:hypothetical protein
MARAVHRMSVAHVRASHRKRNALCTAIQRHLASHPFAADTAQGIVASWLPSGGFEDAPEHIAEALEDLVAEGWLQRHPLPDGNVLYAANLKKCCTSLPIS